MVCLGRILGINECWKPRYYIPNSEVKEENLLSFGRENDKTAKLLFATHTCKESEMQEAITALGKLDVVRGEIAMMRIEK
jgi:homoserine dehydrogenase